MQRLANFLKDLFSVAAPARLPVPAAALAWHGGLSADALCLRDNSLPARGRTATRQIDVCRYRSAAELHEQMHRLDAAPQQTARLTVVLVLGDFLRDNLSELIQRRASADRLVIVPQAGHWPGFDSFGDLALAASALGWKSIELRRDMSDTPEKAVPATDHDQHLLLVLPTETPVRDIM